VDEMRYGDKAGPPMTSYASPGLVYQRLRGEAQQAATWVDSDGSADWVTPRLHRVGESTIPARSFATDATLYASPDHSYRVLSGLLDGATRRVVLHVYDLRHQALVDHLEASARRGVSVDVLVHGSPIGQDEAERFETAHALQRVESAGGRAWLAGSGRYSFHHLKVLVVDDHVAIQSENWVPSGVPQDPSWGNRGWGIVLHSAEAAAWFANWMAEDRAAWDTERFDLASYAPFYREPPRFFPHRDAYRPRAAPALISAMQVDVVVSPEHTNDPARDPVAAVASTATQRLWVEQMDLRSHASNRLGFRAEDPLYGAILASGASDKRVLAATPFRADDLGNREVLGLLAAAGVAVGELERAGIVALHNKGLIADDAVVIGSMNGNHASRSQNREVAVIVHSAEAAEFYAALFADDWRHLVAVGATQESPWPMLFLPLALAALLRRSRA
jgi:cardiolipin synthase A/B